MTTALSPSDTLAAPITRADLAGSIRAQVHGDVVTPDDASYPAAVFGIDRTAGLPELVVIAADAHDIAVTTRVAIRAGRRVVLQVAGRLSGAAGRLASPTVMIVTRLLAHVRIDPSTRTATVGIGASWRQVQDAAAPYGLTAVRGPLAGMGALGSDGTTQPAAFGFGFGFSADHVTALDVVTPLGDQILVDKDLDPSSFAAYRRRRGVFGLVTAMRIVLLPTDRVTAGDVWFDGDHWAAVHRAWRGMTASLPPGTSATIARRELPDSRELPAQLRSRTVVHVRLGAIGESASGAHLIDTIRHAALALWESGTHIAVPS